MSWNIRRRITPLAPRRVDRWHNRAPRVQALLEAEHPAILSAQEALPDQVRFLRDALGKTYRAIGHGRGADGRGEACPIVYDNNRFQLLDWKQSALSDDPDRPGSTSWGNLIPRIMIAATFRDRISAQSFMVVNTHLDHLSRRSRLRSARAIREELSGNRLPAVVTGDLNADAAGEPLRELLAQGVLTDAWQVAQVRRSQLWGTFPNYRAPHRDGRRLDWVLVSPAFRVGRAAINPRRYRGGWPSDHLPVQAELLLSETGDAE